MQLVAGSGCEAAFRRGVRKGSLTTLLDFRVRSAVQTAGVCQRSRFAPGATYRGRQAGTSARQPLDMLQRCRGLQTQQAIHAASI